MKPLIPITDPAFKYVPSHATDIRKRFEQVRKQLELAKKVIPITRGK